MGPIPARTQHLLLGDEIDTEHASTRRGAHARFCAANRHRPE